MHNTIEGGDTTAQPTSTSSSTSSSPTTATTTTTTTTPTAQTAYHDNYNHSIDREDQVAATIVVIDSSGTSDPHPTSTATSTATATPSTGLVTPDRSCSSHDLGTRTFQSKSQSKKNSNNNLRSPSAKSSSSSLASSFFSSGNTHTSQHAQPGVRQRHKSHRNNSDMTVSRRMHSVRQFIRRRFPILTWLVCDPGYSWRANLAEDLFAGICKSNSSLICFVLWIQHQLKMSPYFGPNSTPTQTQSHQRPSHNQYSHV